MKEFKNIGNSVKKVTDSSIQTANTVSVESLSPLAIKMKFPSRGNSSRKRKCLLIDRIYKKIAKLDKRINDLQKINTEATCSIPLYSKHIVGVD